MSCRANHMLCLAAFLGACLCATESLTDESMGDVMGNVAPRGDIRVVYHADGHPIRKHLSREPETEDLCEFVDNLAEGAVDVMTHMCFYSGFTLWRSEHGEPIWSRLGATDQGRMCTEFLWNRGIEPIAVYAGRCHEKGMKYLAKFRMNDRHNQGKLTGPHSVHTGQFLRDHQDWWLKAYPGGLDYTHQGVRDWMFTLAEEVTGKFDIDGLTFNYIRYPYVFEPPEARQKQALLTEFMRRVRTMLDEEGGKKDRKMLFCVVVPTRLEDCLAQGLDVPTWISEGIIDIVCPSDYGSSDFDAPYEEFARLTRESACLLHPAAHPYPERARYERLLMSVPAYRGLARNFYASGADGFSLFNYMYHWSGIGGWGYVGAMDSYPKAFGTFREINDPDKAFTGDRHYIAFPLPGFFGTKDQRTKIVLNRKETGTFKGYTFRAAEDWRGAERAMVRFVAVGLVPADRITVKFNGEAVPDADLTLTFHATGRQNENEGAKLPAYTAGDFVPRTPPEEPLKQVLEIALAESGAGAEETLIVVPEIELAVAAGSGDPLQVMDEIRFHPGPPMKVLAGNHPVHAVLWGHVMDAGQMAGNVGSAAIGFTLKKKAQVRAVDVAMQPSNPGDWPYKGDEGGVIMSIQRDKGGKPEGKPVSDAATARRHPWKQKEGLTLQLQGYYKFSLAEPIALDAGDYWICLQKGRGGGNGVYYVFFHTKPEMGVGPWIQNGTKMENRWVFFGVHGE